MCVAPFKLVIENPPRTMTRQQWKEASRYLRTVAKKIEQNIAPIWEGPIYEY